MPSPLISRGGKRRYKRGKKFSVYSQERDWKKHSKRRLKKWSNKKRHRYAHTSD